MKIAFLRRFGFFCLFCLTAVTAAAQSGAFTYQGVVRVNDAGFTGTGRFKFALVTVTNANASAEAVASVNNGFITGYTVTQGGSGYTTAPAVTVFDSTGSGATASAVITDGVVTSVTPVSAGSGHSSSPVVVIAPPGGASGYVTHWTHDGTGAAGEEPASAMSVAVTDGLFVVTLGDTGLGGMRTLPALVFTNADLRLRIWFDDGVNGFAALEPPQPLTAAPYANRAASVDWTGVTGLPDGFTEGLINATGPGLLLTNNLLSIGANALTASMLATGAVTSAAIADGSLRREDLGPTVLNNSFWSLSGNTAFVTGTNSAPDTNFIGTLDNRALDFRVNDQRALRLEPNGSVAPNVIAGFGGNVAGPGAVGVTIAGGGAGAHEGVAFTNRVDGSFGVVGGGLRNTVQSDALASVIGGGSLNVIQLDAAYAVIAGGRQNTVQSNSNYSFIGAGHQNTVGTNVGYAVIGGGYQNTVRNGSGYAALGGGSGNVILTNAAYAVIGGGQLNTNGGFHAVIPGGQANAAFGAHSVAMGRRAKAVHPGAFVWSDGTDADTVSTATNQFTVRAAGGARFFSNGGMSAGVSLATGGTSWGSLSDEAAKKNRRPVDGREILDRLAAVPVESWNYLWEEDGAPPHLGPMAQGFKRAFYPGRDDRTISTQETDGVVLAAIQGLNRKLEEQLAARDAELKALREEMEALRSLVRDMAK